MKGILRFGASDDEFDPEDVPDEQTLADPEDENVIELLDKFEGQQRSTRAAVNLAVAGTPYPEIARILGYKTARYAAAAVEAGLANMYPPENAATLRQKQAARIEEMIRIDRPAALDPKHSDHFAAGKHMLDLMTRQARLTGIDAPQLMAVINPDAQEVDRIVMQMLRAQGELEEGEADILELPEGADGVYRKEDDDEQEAAG